MNTYSNSRSVSNSESQPHILAASSGKQSAINLHIISVRTMLEWGMTALSVLRSSQFSPEVRAMARRRFLRQRNPTAVG
jgi:hypothetical protein